MRYNACLAVLSAVAVTVLAMSFVGDVRNAARGKPDRDAGLGIRLTSLEGCCKAMHRQQAAVSRDTKRLDDELKSCQQHLDAAAILAHRQDAIVKDATRVILRLEAEETAVAFPEVFRQLRDEMKQVHARLAQGDAGAKTQELQRDIVDTLHEMVSALVKPRRCG